MSRTYGKSDAFVVHQESPFNGGVPATNIPREDITRTEDFYVRGHGPVPSLDADSHVLHVRGMIECELTLSLNDLKRDFPIRTLEVTLQCAGNRRRELHDIRPMQKNALLWEAEAISNATWTGVEMGDVLRAAGVKTGASDAAMLGHDLGAAPDGGGFGGSISIDKALMPGTLLVWEMNGKPLPPIHGAPLRAIIPGYIAARSVKWLTQLIVQDHPSRNHFQAHDYKTFPKETNEYNVNWITGTMLNEHATHAAILSPGDGETVDTGNIPVHGYALAAGNAVITRVELSTDGGQTWHSAVFDSHPRLWVWARWSCKISLPIGNHTLIVRAYDSDGYIQPQHPAEIWNFRGYQNNAWHHVKVEAVSD